MKVQYFVYNGMDKVEIKADSVSVLVDGFEVELTFRKSDNEISISSISHAMAIVPRASNVVRIKKYEW